MSTSRRNAPEADKTHSTVHLGSALLSPKKQFILLTVHRHIYLFVNLVCLYGGRLFTFEESTLPEEENKEEEEEKTADNCSDNYPHPVLALTLKMKLWIRD